MAKVKIDVDSKMRGGLFDNPSAKITRFVIDSNELLAQTGVTMVKARLKQVLQNPSGRYESLVQVERVGQDRVITDGGRVLYGPWLEGVGTRNYPMTRFRGYRTFRFVTQELDRRRNEILRPVINRMINDLS